MALPRSLSATDSGCSRTGRRTRCSSYELVDALTRCWVRCTGRRIELPPGHWLDGPSGDVPGIGDAWLAREVAHPGSRGRPRAGRGPAPVGRAALDGPGFAPRRLVAVVAARVARRWLISAVLARRLGQLSLPLRPLEVAHGMISEVTPVRAADGTVTGTSWHRRLRATGDTVCSGWYGVAAPPGADRPAVRVAFPLPGGRLVVLLRPEVTAAGGLRLTSGPGGWGEDGAYLVVQQAGRMGADRARARAVPRPCRRRGRAAHRPRPAAVVDAGAAPALPADARRRPAYGGTMTFHGSDLSPAA